MSIKPRIIAIRFLRAVSLHGHGASGLGRPRRTFSRLSNRPIVVRLTVTPVYVRAVSISSRRVHVGRRWKNSCGEDAKIHATVWSYKASALA